MLEIYSKLDLVGGPPNRKKAQPCARDDARQEYVQGCGSLRSRCLIAMREKSAQRGRPSSAKSHQCCTSQR